MLIVLIEILSIINTQSPTSGPSRALSDARAPSVELGLRRDAVGVSPLIRQGHAAELLVDRLLGEPDRRLWTPMLADAFGYLVGQRVPPCLQQRVVRRFQRADILPPLVRCPARATLLPRSLGRVLGAVGEGVPPRS